MHTDTVRVTVREAACLTGALLVLLCRCLFIACFFVFLFAPYRLAMIAFAIAAVSAIIAGCYDIWASPWRGTFVKLWHGIWEPTALLAIYAAIVVGATALFTYGFVLPFFG